MLMILGMLYVIGLMILGILYVMALIASDLLGVVIASIAVLLLFFGWRERRIALGIILAGSAGAAVGAGAYSLLDLLLKTTVSMPVSLMWAGAGFGLAGLAGGVTAGSLEAGIALAKRYSSARRQAATH
jgi:hypothetical protein